jgi:hypothetical protein
MFSKSKNAGKQRDRQPRKREKKRRESNILGGLAAGVLAGIVATWVLDKYQQGAIDATRRAEDAANAGRTLSRQQEDQLREQQRAHAQAAQRIAKSAVGRKLSSAQQRNAAAIMHYTAGALAGGAYGLAAEIMPAVRRGYGTGYANMVFLGGSQALLPWLGLSPRQNQVTPAGLPAPLVFGAALETTRRLLRWLL